MLPYAYRNSRGAVGVLDARTSNLRDLARYAPVRVALTGLWRIVFGALLAIPAGALIYIGPGGEPGATRAPGDMPVWWMFVVGLGFGVVALAFFTGGVGRIVSALMRDCYFRAGAEGLAVRMPLQGLFGRFRMVEYHYRWEEIEELKHFTRTLNVIPVARELHIRLYGGREVTIERFYFSATVKSLLEELIWIRELARK
jgi:hypothetical protein